MIRVYTFVISHFSEKVRWVLDLEGTPYVEHRLLPGPHMLRIPRIAPRSSVPVLDHDGHVVQGSSKILDYLQEVVGSSRLGAFGARRKEAADLETLADHAFGLGVQRIFYSELLNDRKTVVDLWVQDGPRWGRGFYAVAFQGVAKAVRRMYRTEPEAVERAKDRFRKAFDAVDQALSESPYLDGSAPGRTDITVAALLAPLCRPPEHLVRWPEAPEGLRPFSREFAGRPTWEHVLKMYREHRSTGT